jgi:hypothetical protein
VEPNPTRQRSAIGRDSGPSNVLRTKCSPSSNAFLPDAVYGIFPFGGSTIQDERFSPLMVA